VAWIDRFLAFLRGEPRPRMVLIDKNVCRCHPQSVAVVQRFLTRHGHKVQVIPLLRKMVGGKQ